MKMNDTPMDSKKLILRVILFIVAFAIAVISFARAVVNIGAKEEGYHEVETNADENAMFYGSGISLNYYFTGSSDEIKSKLNEVKNFYSASLNQIYKLLDAENEYEGCNNLATLNHNLGKEIEIDERLYQILVDAYGKTQERQNFNMFAGTVFSEWNGILILSDAASFDPLFNESEKERLEAISEKTANLSYFSLDFVDDEKHLVKFSVSQEYLQFMEEMEISSSILDLNSMRDAYEVQMVAKELSQGGFLDGYLMTESGINYLMGEHRPGAFCVYGKNEDAVPLIGTVEATQGLVFSQISAFPLLDGKGYYSVEKNGVIYYRYPFFSVQSGDFPEVLSTSYMATTKGNVVDTWYDLLNLHGAKSAGEVESKVASLKQKGAFVAYTLQGNEKNIYIKNENAVSFQLDDQSGYQKIA